MNKPLKLYYYGGHKNLLINVKGKTFERTRSGSIMEDDSVIGRILRDTGIDLWGVAGFEGIKPRLIGCSALKRLPERAASVIVLLLPYYSGRHDFANISKYAMPRDYHITAFEIIGAAAKGLKLQSTVCVKAHNWVVTPSSGPKRAWRVKIVMCPLARSSGKSCTSSMS